MSSWISHYPQWFVSEYQSVLKRYPHFRVHEGALHSGFLIFFGELVIRPPGGTKRQAVRLGFPAATPHVFPVVTPIKGMPEFDADGNITSDPEPVFFDQLHQLPGGGLCLFHQETRGAVGGESIRAVDVLKRAEKWFLGHFTGHWPPDSQRSELENHFYRSGDILLGDRLFDNDLTGWGEFYAARDVQKLFITRSNDRTPLLITAIVDKGTGVATVQDARRGLSSVFPWLENDFWTPESLAELDDKQRTDNDWHMVISRGFWWTLKSEPSPFRNGEGLLRALQEVAPDGDSWKVVSQAMGSAIATENVHLIGLKYPARTGGSAWLVVQVQTESVQATGGGIVLAANDGEKLKRFARGRVTCYRSHAVRPDDIHLRNEGVISTDVRDKTVALVGLGSLGSKVAELLTQAGVGRFRLCDYDQMAVGNVARHIGSVSDAGSPKWRVVRTRIHGINPFASVEPVRLASATADLEKFGEFCRGADVVISTIADESAEAALNQVAVDTGATMIYGRAMRRGEMGRVFLVRPGKDACKACLSKYANDSHLAAASGWIAVTESDEDSLLQECGRPVIPASAVDLSFTAGLIARKALDVLEGLTIESNHVVWSRSKAPDVDPRFDKQFSAIESTFQQLSECPVCQSPPIGKIVIPDSISQEIAALVEQSPTDETGGVLMGYLEGRVAIVTRMTGPGPNAIRTPTRIERDVAYVQSQVELAIAELGAKGLYIGEWHSHIQADPEPSGQDIRSMVGIANAPNYATTCPVMLIAGFDPKAKKCATVKAWAFPAEGRAHQIELSTSPATAIQTDLASDERRPHQVRNQAKARFGAKIAHADAPAKKATRRRRPK